jgi:FkbM family methyltransferase
MLIPFGHCVQLAGFHFRSVVHIGAHTGEEISAYSSCGVAQVVWFEANRSLIPLLKESTGVFNVRQEYFCEVLSDMDGEEVSFSITNNGQSSSILELGTHRIHHPHIHVVQKTKLITKRFDSVLRDHEDKIGIDSVDFVNLDVQGAELKVLRGFGDCFSENQNIRAVYTEVNTEEVYVGCALLYEIDSFLEQFGFKRVATAMTDANWGDALYLRT